MCPLLITLSPALLVFTRIPAIPLVVPVAVASFGNDTAVSATFVNSISRSFLAVVFPLCFPPNAIANPFLLLAPL